jgi:tryptophan synthase alpha subunit
MFNPQQARFVAQNADAVVVGSVVVNQIAEHATSPGMVRRVSEFVTEMAQASR